MTKAPVMSRADVESKLSETMFSKFTKVQQAFRTFDRSHTGNISHMEFRNALRSIGFELTDSDFRDFVATYDKVRRRAASANIRNQRRPACYVLPS